jgi:capsular polysaccharide biosynthesis protein
MTSAKPNQTATGPLGQSLPSIASLASDVVWLEQERPLEPGATVSLGSGFADRSLLTADEATLFDLRIGSEAVRTYRLRDVALDGALLMLYGGALPIPETIYLIEPSEYDDALTKDRPLQATDPNQHYIIACNRGFANYYHWVVQTLPAIDWGLRNRGQLRATLAMPALPQPWHNETLALLGHADAPRLTIDRRSHYHFASAEFTEFLGWRMPGIVSYAAADTYARLRLAVPPAVDGPNAIYIARTDASNRVMTNEPALIAMLQERGIQIVVPGNLSVSRQIALFRSARLIIGPHGAGLSNIVFCEPASYVYELVPAHTPNYCFNRLAQGGGLHYWADVFAAASAPDARHGTWQVDIDIVIARLDQIEAEIAATTPPLNAMDFLRRHATRIEPAPDRRAAARATPDRLPWRLAKAAARALGWADRRS